MLHLIVPKASRTDKKGAKANRKRAKERQKSQKEAKGNPKGNRRTTKSEAETFKDSACGTEPKKEKKEGGKCNIFWSHFWSRFNTNTIQKTFKNPSPQNMKIYTKRLPKWSRHRCQNSLKINATTGTDTDKENHQIYIFWNVKTTKSAVRVIVFEGFARWVRERKIINKSSKMRLKSMPKSMKNQCKFHARKSDAKNIENHQNWSPKGSHEPSKINKKWGKKKDAKNEPAGEETRGDLGPRRHSFQKTFEDKLN